MEKESLIQVNQISRDFGEYRAVDQVSFNIHRGEVMGFLGPNGAGKTTTMQIIAGVLAATEGEVTVCGYDIVELGRQAKAHIGFLPESPPLYTDLTVDEYLLYTAALRNIPRKARKDSLQQSKARCGLEDVGHRLIRNLSKGYQQRVGIAQAIIHQPAVVILDEPTSGLDPIQILEIRDLIRELGQDHSVILSTHILPEVQTVCDRVVIINQGKLVMDASLDQLQQQQTNSFKLGLKNPPELGALSAIEHVQQVQQLDSEHFHIEVAEGQNIQTLVARTAVAHGWELFELIPDSSSLEHIFLKLTHQTEPVSTKEAAA